MYIGNVIWLLSLLEMMFLTGHEGEEVRSLLSSHTPLKKCHYFLMGQESWVPRTKPVYPSPHAPISSEHCKIVVPSEIHQYNQSIPLLILLFLASSILNPSFTSRLPCVLCHAELRSPAFVFQFSINRLLYN